MVKRRTRDREVPGSIPTNCKCCFLEQKTLSTLLSTGFYPGKKRATWKISTRLLNVLPSINKVDYYYYYYLNHPPCSPDLAPSDYYLFRNLKSNLSGTRFRDDDESRLLQRFGLRTK